ncbi:MAG: hypothetical protein GY953_28330, partial [bacterium]|nr:hypothetical protein [bacterium]
AEIFRRQLENRVLDHRFGGHYLPINADSGFHTGLARLPKDVPLATTEDFENYLARLNALPRYFGEQTAQSAKDMIGVLIVAALLWGTGALPIGITALLVGLLMYILRVFEPEVVADAYAKDAVIFIMGVIALARGIAKTGLDRRIGILLLGTSRSLVAFLFLFCPLLAVSASFVSANAMIVFVVPILMMVFMGAVKGTELGKDRSLAVVFILSTCYVANAGGPGSPAAGGRNALMIGILSDYGMAPSFGEWVSYGLPFVPVMALVVAAYFFLRFRRSIVGNKLDIAAIVRKE